MSISPGANSSTFRFTILCLALTSAGACLAQEACREKAFSVMERIRTDLEEAEQNRLYSKLVVTVQPSEVGAEAVRETMELISGDQRTAYVTPQLMMLEDRDARVVVMPLDQEVYIYDHMPIEKAPNETWWRFTELAFTSGKLLSCHEAAGKSGQELTVEFDVSHLSAMNGIQKLRMVLDATHAKPIAYRTVFSPKNPIRERRFDFLAFEPGKADARVTTSVLTQVLPNGKLAHTLRGYALKDKRSGAKTLRSTMRPE
jgi:hypothetical protein